jgi:hypothetical protein
MDKKKISFSEVSWPIKTAVAVSWVIGVMFSVLFLIGFIQEALLL